MRRLRTFEALEERRLMAPMVVHDGVAYISDTFPTSIVMSRFVIADKAWLPNFTLTLPYWTSSSLTVGNDGIYVAFGNRVDRFDLDGTNRVELVSAAARPIDRLFVDEIDESLLIMTHAGGAISTLDLETNAQTLSASPTTKFTVGAHDAVNNRLFGELENYAATWVQYDALGALSSQIVANQPFAQSSISVITLWITPDRQRVIARSGDIYEVLTGSRLGRFESPVESVLFMGDNPVIRYRDEAILYSADTMLPVGAVDVHPEGVNMLTTSDELIVIVSSYPSPWLQVFPIENFPAKPTELHPRRLAYEPDAIVPTVDGNLLLLSARNRSIFRWDSATQDYGPTINLYGSPQQISYSESLNTAFLLYPSGLLSKIDFNAAEAHEELLAILDQTARIIAAGPYLLTQSSTSPSQIAVRNADDLQIVSNLSTTIALKDGYWDDANQAVYFNRQGSSSVPYLLTFDGTQPGTFLGAPDPGATKYAGPFRISPDGSLLITGSGHILDGRTLARDSRMLPRSTDSAWLENRLYTIRKSGPAAELKRWNADLSESEASLFLPEQPLGLFAVATDQLVAVMRDSAGIVTFTLVDENLNVITPAWSEVVGRHLFYNNSRFDQDARGIDENDAAIAPDKAAYLPASGRADLRNVSSYSRGINGVMIDIARAPDTMLLSDFVFRLGIDKYPDSWQIAPSPSGFSIRPGAGVNGSTRVEFIWPDGAVQNTWLQIEVRANERTGLVAISNISDGEDKLGDVFYFANQIGDTGSNYDFTFRTNHTDELFTRGRIGWNLPITEIGDHDKDGKVSASDILIARANFSSPQVYQLSLRPVVEPLSAIAAAAEMVVLPASYPVQLGTSVPVGDSRSAATHVSSVALGLAMLDMASDIDVDHLLPASPKEPEHAAKPDRPALFSTHGPLLTIPVNSTSRVRHLDGDRSGQQLAISLKAQPDLEEVAAALEQMHS